MRSKILSLELILAMIDNPPEKMKKTREFIVTIKDILCDSILKNSVSHEKPIFSLSLSIFLGLFMNFRTSLKHEIGIFIEEIFLRILDSGNSSYQHKFLILQVFNKISYYPKCILELFVNYDCDVERKNIFERIIACLGKIAQGKYAKSEHTNIIQPNEEYSLKIMALQTLITMVDKMYEFVMTDENSLNSSSELKSKTLTETILSEESEGELENEKEEEELQLPSKSNSTQAHSSHNPPTTNKTTEHQKAPLQSLRDKESSKEKDTKESSTERPSLSQDQSSKDKEPTKDKESKDTNKDPTLQSTANNTQQPQNINQYEKALKQKNFIAKAVVKFNLKPKTGINYLMQNNFIRNGSQSEKVKDIVNFLRNTEDLDKAKIGEYFGEDVELCKECMYAFIDAMDFRAIELVSAIRVMLNGFRLPGESQKIDRILMKFGERFYKDNPNAFVSADAPYELSYAIMILQTTTHNPHVKRKMSFVRMKEGNF